jgi:signal transduction histidine kinase
MCCYQLASFSSESHEQMFHDVCATHSHVVASESYSQNESKTQYVAHLQQRTMRLQAEMARRRALEQELRAAKEAAEVASMAKTSFLANMSHEVRTTLARLVSCVFYMGEFGCMFIDVAQ